MSEHLRALALAAMATESSPNYHEHERAFEYAATPAAILALLDELADHERAYALLFKENAELRKDTERYRWLRFHYLRVFACDATGGVAFDRECEDIELNSETDGAALDAAIDSAAKGESNE